jgi:hypothetical protein
MPQDTPNFTPRCPTNSPRPPHTSARPWKTPPKTSPRHHLEFSNITAWCFSEKKKRCSYVRCSRRTTFEAPEDSPTLFPGDLIPKTRLIPPRTPPEILPRSRTIQDCSETPQNLPRLPQDLPRFQDCRKTTPRLRPPRNSQIWTKQAPPRISPRAREKLPPRSRKNKCPRASCLRRVERTLILEPI